MAVMNYRFAQCFLDIEKQQLWVEGVCIQTERRNFLLLQILVEHSGETVDRQFLIEHLWPDQIVSDWSLSRLVSDTRKLVGDDGKKQAVIKTCRGGGFMLAVQAIPEQKLVMPKNVALPKQRLLIGAMFMVIFAIGYVIFWQFSAYQQKQQYQHMLAIAQQLDITKTAFIAQLKRRNELGKMLNVQAVDGRMYWEKAFSAAYKQGLNDEQQFVFDQIRAMTTGALYQGNQKLYYLLQQPNIKEQIDSFPALARHLSFWLSKYKEVFIRRRDMCLLYAGVEDGVPFPSEVDQQVADWLVKHKTCNMLFGC